MSEWASPYLQYQDVLQLFETTQCENLNQLGCLVGFFQRLEDGFAEFLRSAKPTDPPSEQVETSVKIVTDAVNGRRSLEPRHDLGGPSELHNSHLCHLASFKRAYRSFKTVVAFLGDFLQEYRQRMESVRTHMAEAMSTLERMRKKFDKSYSKYRRVADRLKQAYDNHDPTLELAKEGFIQAQKEAVEVHTGMNQCRAETAMKLDSGLKEFEELENWRSEQLRSFMIHVSEWLEEFAQQIEDGNLVLLQLSRLIPEPTTLMEICNCGSVVRPACDDRFQFVKLDPRITTLLDPKDMFQEEQASGCRLFRVTADCEGRGQYLHVSRDEVVCGLQSQPVNVLVKNINESTGLVPTSVLTPL